MNPKVYKSSKKLWYAHHKYCVYIIQAGKYYKVGYSTNPKARVATMSTCLPIEPKLKWVRRFRSKKSMRECEKYAHKMLKNAHKRGEWFQCPFTVIKNVINDYTDEDVEAEKRAKKKNWYDIEKFCQDMGWPSKLNE